MYFDDVTIGFAVVFSPDVELVIDSDVFEFFAGGFFDDQDDICESEENDIQTLELINQKDVELVEIFAFFFDKYWLLLGRKLLFQLV